MKKNIKRKSSNSFKLTKNNSNFKLFINDYNKKRIKNVSNSTKKSYIYTRNNDIKKPIIKVKETLNFFKISKRKKVYNLKNELIANKLKYKTHLKLIENIKENNNKNYKFNIKNSENIINENKKRIKKIIENKDKILNTIIYKKFKINQVNYKINKMNIENDKFKPKNLIGNKLEYIKYKNSHYLFLYGGQINKKFENIYLYNINKNQWIDYSKFFNEVSRYFPALINYKKNKIIIYGGWKNSLDEKMNILGNCKLVDFEKNKIINLKVKSKEEPILRKNFAYCNHHDNLVLFGGLDSDCEVLNDLWIGYIRSESIFWMKMISDEEIIGLSHSSIISPSPFNNSKKNVKYDYIYLFGGINNFDICSNKLYKFIIEKQNIKWEKIITKGKKPKPRFSCTLNFSFRLNCLIIFGGIDLNHHIFNDLYLFYFKY